MWYNLYYNQSVSGILQFINMFYIFISFVFSLVTLTNFLHQNKEVHLDLFHAKKATENAFFIKYEGSQVKLYIIWKLYFLSTKHKLFELFRRFTR